MSNQSTRYKSKKLFPELKECEKCGSKSKLIRHHTDYNRPDIVMVLCKQCHGAWHAFNRPINHDGKKIKRNNVVSFNLRFTGNKVELKKQLEELCEKTGKSQNATLIECVEALLATREEKTN